MYFACASASTVGIFLFRFLRFLITAVGLEVKIVQKMLEGDELQKSTECFRSRSGFGKLIKKKAFWLFCIGISL